MTTFHRVTSMRTLIILMALPSALGYATSATPISKPAFLPTTVKLPPKTVPSNHPQRYDLGLGKNAPLTNDSHAKSQSENVETACHFWIAPEPAKTCPSPRSLEKRSFAATTQSHPKVSKKSIRKSIPVHLKRQSEDDLQISRNGIIMSRSSNGASQLDLNTVWVEALIHNQQKQLAHAK